MNGMYFYQTGSVSAYVSLWICQYDDLDHDRPVPLVVAALGILANSIASTAATLPHKTLKD